MLKEIVIAFQSYRKAHLFITKHDLWKWIIPPGVLYTLMVIFGLYFFLDSADSAVTWLSHIIGIERWLHHQQSAFLSFFFVMGGIMVRIVCVFFCFSLFKYFFLIIGSPLFTYLSELTEALISGKEYQFRLNAAFWNVMMRGIRLALRNCLWQTVYLICLLILSFIPLVGWITPVVAIFVECNYFGFSMLDYSCERHGLSDSASIEYIGKHRGLAIGNGIIFYLLHFAPVLAPSYSVIAATISLYNQNLE